MPQYQIALATESLAQELMRDYCEEAVKYGEQPLPLGSKPRQITVVLNPAANKRFKTYFFVLATSFTDIAMDSTVVTGLLRRPDGEIATSRKFPIGILPLGRTNTVGNALFAKDTNTVRTMADSAMAIIREFAKPIDVVKIEALETETDLPGKPIYCLAGIEWGAYRDTNARKDKYWYFDGLRWYAAYLFNGLKSDISWRCEADLDFSLPCTGCSSCHTAVKQDVLSDKQKVGARWWQSYLPRLGQSPATNKYHVEQIDYSQIHNKACGIQHRKEVSTIEFSLTTANVGPKEISYMDFVAEGWKRIRGQEPFVEEKLKTREFELRPALPNNSKEQEKWISIDNEDYELKPIHLANPLVVLSSTAEDGEIEVLLSVR
uniref:Acylglycerol kinase, mitochondrial n=1 Tax=Timema cristinae TaxID=61476 RepID=A0A7R9GYH1_TIMCR|nr:unnamed protein product [Timema cristinae]